MSYSFCVGKALRSTNASGITTYETPRVTSKVMDPKSPSSKSQSSNGVKEPDIYRIKNIFAVISSANRIRNYPWGSIHIDNEKISDFTRLKTLLFERGTFILHPNNNNLYIK